MISYKIIISCHDEHPILLKSEHIIYVQTGAENAKRIFNGMIQDNIGENISSRNIKYNELTAQYWAWKNFSVIGDPDYIGFMHYRRHFLFDEMCKYPKETWLPNSNVHFFSYISEKYKNKFSDTIVRLCIENNDCIVICPYDVTNLGKKCIKDQYVTLEEQEKSFFDIFIDSAKKIYPEYKREIEMIEYGKVQYLCNMFIMKKELFFRYNEFMFSILEDVEKKIDTSGFSEKKQRFLGYFGEFLLSIFIFKLKNEGQWRIKELHASFLLSDKYIPYPRLKYFQYWILSKITFGKLGKKCMHKKIYYRDICKHIN